MRKKYLITEFDIILSLGGGRLPQRVYVLAERRSAERLSAARIRRAPSIPGIYYTLSRKPLTGYIHKWSII